MPGGRVRNGAAASVAYARLRALRNVATWLALAPLVFAAVFFSRHDVVSLVLRGVDVDLGVIHVEHPLPIVIVVFDELRQGVDKGVEVKNISIPTQREIEAFWY